MHNRIIPCHTHLLSPATSLHETSPYHTIISPSTGSSIEMSDGVDSRTGELAMPLLPSSLEEDDPATVNRSALSQEMGHPSEHQPPNHRQRQHRILDREGRFGQSRGRWSVAITERGVRHRRAARASGESFTPADGDTSPPTTTTPHRKTPPNRLRRRLSYFSASCCAPSPSFDPTIRSCWDDWFHTISYTPTCILLLLVFLAYFCTIVVFAGLYYSVNKLGVHYGHVGAESEGESSGGVPPGMSYVATDEEVESFCGMDINTFMEAMYFSLSTMATIGYGVSDYYFGNCWTPFLLVLLQVFSALAFSSLAIGLLFQRMSRGQKRGRTIVFSDISILRKVRGQWYWMFRVAELRKRHIIGAKVRVFCVRHERSPSKEDRGESGTDQAIEMETAYFVSHPVAILSGCKDSVTKCVKGGDISARPTSALDKKSLGADSAYEQNILMGLPHVVVHCVDEASPIMPPRPVWYDEMGLAHGPVGKEAKPASLLACIEEGSQRSILDAPSQEEITSFLDDRQAEVIVCLEGICEITGMTLQARHSYRIEDMAFHHTFAPCVFPPPSLGTAASASSSSETKRWLRWLALKNSNAKTDDFTENVSAMSSELDSGYLAQSPALEVDFSRFHALMPAPLDCLSCPYVPDWW